MEQEVQQEAPAVEQASAQEAVIQEAPVQETPAQEQPKIQIFDNPTDLAASFQEEFAANTDSTPAADAEAIVCHVLCISLRS